MRNNRNAWVAILFSFFLFSVYSVKSQGDNKILNFEELMQLNDSLEGSVLFYFYWLSDSYYSAYLEFPQTPNQLFNFGNNEELLIAKRTLSILKKNSTNFYFEDKDSIFFVFYDKNIFATFYRPFGCNEFSEYSEKRKMIRIFDKEGFFIWNKKIAISFRKDLDNIYKKYIEQAYTTIFSQEDSNYIMASNKPKIIVYQYDNVKNLTIHKLCSCNFDMSNNQYLVELKQLSMKYCKRYNLSKIIFAARIMR